MKKSVGAQYKSWFLINQHEFAREFGDLEKEAVSIFSDFIDHKDYGKGIGLFRFDLYVEDDVNYGRHNDAIYSGCAHLSANLNAIYFNKNDVSGRIKIVMTASLILIKYLKDRMTIPKGFDVERLEMDYCEYLRSNNYLLDNDEIEKSIVKPFDTTRFNFVITSTIEVEKDKIHYDLNDLQNFINNKLAGKTFGESVRRFDFGFEIFDFNGQFASFKKQTEDLRRYGAKYKMLLVVKQFNYDQMKDLDRKGQYEIIKNKMLEAITDIDKLNKKPKDFDRDGFYTCIEDTLSEYGKSTGMK